ncbi:MAG: hypothetical protein IJU65_01965 [Desulfovibrio sp.]|nr:hypothetical protein [Desulfovibrio sp.]
MTEAERQSLRQRIAADKAAAEVERAKCQAKAATLAASIWKVAPLPLQIIYIS